MILLVTFQHGLNKTNLLQGGPFIQQMVFEIFKTKSPQEVVRENKRMLDRSIRELDRERTQIEGQVKKTMTEMKKMAKAGQDVRSKMPIKEDLPSFV